MCRPMYYDWSNREETYDFDGQFMLGDSLLCAPITEPIDESTGAARVRIWLPPGNWLRWHSREMLVGDRIIDLDVTLDEIPMFVREGGGVVLGPDAQSVALPFADPLTCIFVPGDRGAIELYEDDGLSTRHEEGSYIHWSPKWEAGRDGMTIDLAAATGGGYESMPGTRKVELELILNRRVATVHLDDELLDGGAKVGASGWNAVASGGIRISMHGYNLREAHTIAIDY